MNNSLANNNTLNFDLSDRKEAEAMANMIASLNQVGVPYSVQRLGGTEMQLAIGDGF